MQRLFFVVDHSSRRLYRAASTSALPVMIQASSSAPARLKSSLNSAESTKPGEFFGNMIQRDLFSWNAMISYYAQNGRIDEARALFDAILGKDVRFWNNMISGYAKVGQVNKARQLFRQMPVRNIFSWNAMVA